MILLAISPVGGCMWLDQDATTHLNDKKGISFQYISAHHISSEKTTKVLIIIKKTAITLKSLKRLVSLNKRYTVLYFLSILNKKETGLS